jgi:rhamnopyranosyl-N-acetylglucosaminyl-diphospho-decaprenol beta-1,3/1,4-galactofuranosyltransferase
MTVSVASLTTAYNAAHLLPRQLDALLAQSRALQEIVVVDNGSTDGTSDLLASLYPQVKVLKMLANAGAAGAWAAGLEYAALQRRHDWVWAFDDDSVPDTDALDRMLATAKLLPPSTPGEGANGDGLEDRLGMLAMLPVHAGSRECYPPLLWQEGFRRPTSEEMRQPVWFADLAIASGLMVRRKLVEHIGLPRADFFMDFFDFEYCLRARARGYRIAVVTAAKLEHEIGAARRVRLGSFSALWPDHAPWREYYMSRNLTYAVWSLYPSARAKRFALRHLARHAGGVLLFGRNKLACLKKSCQGFADGRRARLGIRFHPLRRENP